jgi:sec-independent protein translocase protein TatA
MFGLGMPELIVILIICLLIFGAAKLPEIGKSLGKTISEFKKSMREVNSDKENKEEEKPQDKK